MKKWEYKKRVVIGLLIQEDQFLNEFGAKGWELVGIAHFKDSLGALNVHYYFKRPIEEEAPAKSPEDPLTDVRRDGQPLLQGEPAWEPNQNQGVVYGNERRWIDAEKMKGGG